VARRPPGRVIQVSGAPFFPRPTLCFPAALYNLAASVTAICIINVDGTGFHRLTDGTHTDFNQTWTRDGTNTPIWNRKNPETGGFYVMKSKVSSSKFS
jgi:hypothetical protein